MKWSHFIILSENKSKLTDFVTNEMIMSEKIDKTVVVAGIFVNEMDARSNDGTLNLNCFKAAHEEADTRLVLSTMRQKILLYWPEILLFYYCCFSIWIR